MKVFKPKYAEQKSVTSKMKKGGMAKTTAVSKMKKGGAAPKIAIGIAIGKGMAKGAKKTAMSKMKAGGMAKPKKMAYGGMAKKMGKGGMSKKAC